MNKLPKFLTCFSLLILSSFVFVKAHAAIIRPVYVGNVTDRSIMIYWKTDTGGNSVVNYGLTTSYGLQATGVAGFKTVDNSPGFLHTVTISGLTPGTKYFYQISTQGTTLTPSGDINYFFKTAPAVGSNTPFTFAILGDSDGDDEIAAQFASLKPDLIITDGDIVYPWGGLVSPTTEGLQDRRYYDTYQHTMKNTPYYVNCGNHDYSEQGCINPPGASDNVFDQENPLPGGGKMGGMNSTYSFDYGNAHFVSLNSNLSITYNRQTPASSSPQVAWAYNDLRNSNQPWKFVYWHHCGWSGRHPTIRSILDNLVSLCEDVFADICFWGHAHVYERWPQERGTSGFYTIGNGGKHSIDGTVCATMSNPTSSTEHPARPCLAHSLPDERGFLFVTVNGNSSTWDYYTAQGVKRDTATYSSGAQPTDNIPPSRPTNLQVR